MKHPIQLVSLAAALALALAGCGGDDASHAVDETRSLAQPRAGQVPAQDPHAGLEASGAPKGFVHPPMTGAPAPTAVAGPNATVALRWTAPEGWTQGPVKPMRVVSFSPPGDPRVDCYVTVLGGEGGGLAANINRWRQQLKLVALTDDAIAALPTIPVLGRDATMVEIDGGKLGLYGVVCALGTETLFVKMTGPTEALRADRETFIEFCKSLSQP